MVCVVEQSVCKRAGETKPWGFNWTMRFARKWAPNSPFASLVRARPSSLEQQTGFQYRSAGGVSSGAVEPRWPDSKKMAAGAITVRDGSILWTGEAIDDASLAERIDEVDWAIPTGIGFLETTPVDTGELQQTAGQFSGGTAGEHYDAIVTVVTTEGNTYQGIIHIEIEEELEA